MTKSVQFQAVDNKNSYLESSDVSRRGFSNTIKAQNFKFKTVNSSKKIASNEIRVVNLFWPSATVIGGTLAFGDNLKKIPLLNNLPFLNKLTSNASAYVLLPNGSNALVDATFFFSSAQGAEKNIFDGSMKKIASATHSEVIQAGALRISTSVGAVSSWKPNGNKFEAGAGGMMKFNYDGLNVAFFWNVRGSVPNVLSGDIKKGTYSISLNGGFLVGLSRPAAIIASGIAVKGAVVSGIGTVTVQPEVAIPAGTTAAAAQTTANLLEAFNRSGGEGWLGEAWRLEARFKDGNFIGLFKDNKKILVPEMLKPVIKYVKELKNT
jgi:hypothetical protein